MLLSGAGRTATDDGMIDSMGMSATLLDALGVSPDPSFKGISAFEGGRPAVVSESCGSGNADISRRDIFFTVTSATHRMMATLVGTELRATQLYDRRRDPREIEDLIADPAQRAVISTLIDAIHIERRDLMDLRGVARPQVAAATST
jgi:arylsulfatase A-like enzyme